MARLNEVRLYGCVADVPKIKKNDSTKEYVRGIMHLAVIRSARYNGKTFGAKDDILYDWPIILSTDPEIIAKMEKLRKFDIVELKGMFVVRKIKKGTSCKHCGESNVTWGNICFVLPMFLEKRNRAKEVFNETQAVQEIIRNREISNSIHISGNLCTDVNYYHEKKIQTASFQIATDRRYYIKDDDPSIRTDFPIVKTFGKQAKQDSLCLHKGSGIIVDGFLHSRTPMRTTVCSACGREYSWEDSVLEINPYAIDYTSNYIDPETALQMEKDRNADEGDAALSAL